MKPWEDCPVCPECKGPFGACDSLAAPDIGCLACGHFWKATPQELAQERRASEAWEKEQQREEQAVKEAATAAELARKYELAKAGKLW